MGRLLRIHIVVVAVMGFAMAHARAESPAPKVTAFDLDGLTLSMAIDDFRQLYPGAEVTEKTAARYCYGKKILIESLTRLGAVIRRGDATIHVAFDHKRFGQGVSTIKLDERIEFDSSRFSLLRERLVRHFGPYTGVKVPGKMDPAGLVVGFEWVQKGTAYMSVAIHRDPASESGAFRQTTFLTRALPGMAGHSMAAAYYRDTVRNFRENCAQRGRADSGDSTIPAHRSILQPGGRISGADLRGKYPGTGTIHSRAQRR